MIEEILSGIFRIEMPLPFSALQSVNCYLLKGEDRNLAIDTGMDTEECRSIFMDALRKLEFDIEKTDFFITHTHEDHFGLTHIVAPGNSTIYMNSPDIITWAVPSRWRETGIKHGKKNGFPLDDLHEYFGREHLFLKKLPLKEIGLAVEAYEEGLAPRGGRFRIIDDGEIINIGEFSFLCLLTRGHSTGHLCLYEPRLKLLFSGDHILETITPSILLWSEEDDNPLYDYLNSLNRLLEMDVNIVLPGHREVFRNFRGRISEIKEHHRIREGEIAGALDARGKSGYEIASKVSWSIPFAWEKFATDLKWMALAETMAHLKYMETNNRVRKETIESGQDLYYID